MRGKKIHVGDLVEAYDHKHGFTYTGIINYTVHTDPSRPKLFIIQSCPKRSRTYTGEFLTRYVRSYSKRNGDYVAGDSVQVLIGDGIWKNATIMKRTSETSFMVSGIGHSISIERIRVKNILPLHINARRAALFWIHCKLPHKDIVLAIAKLVYATRDERAWAPK